MADLYLDSHVGVMDGTKVPAARANGLKVGVNQRRIFGSKPAGVAWANGDQIFLGTLAPGESLREIIVTSDTTLGATTLSVGTKASIANYANARTMTTVDTPTLIGPRGTAADDAPLAGREDIWLTLGGGGIASGINVTFDLVITGL